MNEFFENVILPIAIVFVIFGLPTVAFVVFRVLAHRERMAMIAAGMQAGQFPAGSVPGAYPPPGAVPGTMPRMGPDRFVAEPAQVTLNKGIRLAMIGFAITLGVSLASIHSSDGDLSWHPGPWLLIGLVPMFIGIAQIIIAILSGASAGRFTQSPQAGPGSAPFTVPSPPPPVSSSGIRNWAADPFPSAAMPDPHEKELP